MKGLQASQQRTADDVRITLQLLTSNAVSPGSIDTPGFSDLLASSETGEQRYRSAGSAHPTRSRRPSCFSHPTTAATSRERSCLWMAASHKCRCRIFGGAASSTSYQVAQRTSIGMSTILGNTLLSRRNSLILEIFSLLICLGNCSGKCCSAAVSCSGIGWRSPEIAKFPVKFPDTREFS